MRHASCARRKCATNASAVPRNVLLLGHDDAVVAPCALLIDSLITCKSRHTAPRAHLCSQLVSSFWACSCCGWRSRSCQVGRSAPMRRHRRAGSPAPDSRRALPDTAALIRACLVRIAPEHCQGRRLRPVLFSSRSVRPAGRQASHPRPGAAAWPGPRSLRLRDGRRRRRAPRAAKPHGPAAAPRH